MKQRERIRNAGQARRSFVTRRAENKLSALADIFKASAGRRCERIDRNTLQRELILSGFRYLNSFKLIYNWENRFFAVNYNLQMLSKVAADPAKFEEIGSCVLSLKCTQKGLSGKREYVWQSKSWNSDEETLAAYRKRLSTRLILERLDALDIFEMEVRHDEGSGFWTLSCESMIGSATWIFLPPVTQLITPKPDECIKFFELFELVADAVVDNR